MTHDHRPTHYVVEILGPAPHVRLYVRQADAWAEARRHLSATVHGGYEDGSVGRALVSGARRTAPTRRAAS